MQEIFNYWQAIYSKSLLKSLHPHSYFKQNLKNKLNTWLHIQNFKFRIQNWFCHVPLISKKAHWASASDGATIQGIPNSCKRSWHSLYIWSVIVPASRSSFPRSAMSPWAKDLYQVKETRTLIFLFYNWSWPKNVHFKDKIDSFLTLIIIHQLFIADATMCRNSNFSLFLLKSRIE